MEIEGFLSKVSEYTSAVIVIHVLIEGLLYVDNGVSALVYIDS